MADFTFYRCAVCGNFIPSRNFRKLRIKINKGQICRCGSSTFRPSNAPLWRELIYLAFHPSKIINTVLWPGNWGKGNNDE